MDFIRDAKLALENAQHFVFKQPLPHRADEIVQTDHEIAVEDQLEPWRRNPLWVDEPPITEVTVPKGTLCHLESTFKVGLPPSMVFKIISDPNNKRVFKNIQEVKFRKVIRDEGQRRLVEVEQAAIWKFLCFSGTIGIHVLVDEDESSWTLRYRLAKTGFMKKFEGCWVIKPIQHSDRLASSIKLSQEVQPALVPPPPISWYIRGITTRTTEMMIQDLQAEGQRILKTMAAEIQNITEKQEENKEKRQVDVIKLKTKKLSTWTKHTSVNCSKWILSNNK